MTRIALVLLLMLGIDLVMGVCAALLANLIPLDNNTITAFCSLWQKILLIAVLWITGWAYRKRTYVLLAPKHLTLLCIPLTIACAYAIELGTEWISLPNFYEETLTGMMYDPMGILTICLFAPIAEELTFRAAIEGHLLRMGWMPRRAILLSATLFALIHLNPAQMPFAFGFGILAGWLYYRTDSPWLGIVAHVINNTLSTVLTLSFPNDTRSIVEILGGTLSATLCFVVLVAITALLVRYFDRRLPSPQNLF